MKGLELQARHNELKQQMAISTAEFEAKLRVAQMELGKAMRPRVEVCHATRVRGGTAHC